MTGRHRAPLQVPETILIMLSCMVLVGAVIAWAVITR